MNHRLFHPDAAHRTSLRGFVPFLALLLWLLIAIVSAAPAAAAEGDYIRASDILPDIEMALAEKGMSPDAEVRLDAPEAPMPANATVTHVSYNPLSGRFVVRLDGTGQALTGVASVSASYPALKRDITRGEMIGEADIAWIDAPTSRSRGVIMDAEDLIGMSARRPLAALTPLRSVDVEAPMLIKRGAIVTLTYEIAGLRMTHQGVAGANGAKGDIIPVRNIDSDRALKGVVAGENLITILPRRGAYQG